MATRGTESIFASATAVTRLVAPGPELAKQTWARPLARVIQEHIKKPLAEELLFGKLAKGGIVLVKREDGKITFDFPDPKGSKLPIKRKKGKAAAGKSKKITKKRGM